MPDPNRNQKPSLAPVDPERAAIVDRAIDGWVSKLIDTTRNNNLLYFRELKLGTIEFTDADPDELAALLAGREVPVMSLVAGGGIGTDGELHDGDDLIVAELADSDLEARVAARIQTIQRKAMENAEERGLSTMHVVVGMATWPIDDGGRPPQAPVILIPVEIVRRGLQERGHRLRRTGDVQVNPVLIHALNTRFSIRVENEGLLDRIPGIEEETDAFDPAPVFERIAQAAADISGFAIANCVWLGNFAFAKMAMVQDLLSHRDEIRRHDLIAATAGHTGARAAVAAGHAEPDPRDFDRIPPAAEHLILDADSSQQAVIAQATADQSGVVQGPPGTGKSQTIANVIAEMAARHGKVLFVAEKRAALEVVRNRLAAVGLGHLILDLHGAAVSKKQVMERIAHALDELPQAVRPADEECHREFDRHRTRLNDHLERLLRPRKPAGKSVRDMQAALLPVSAAARLSTRWAGRSLESMTDEHFRHVAETLADLAAFDGVFLGTSPSPWCDAHIHDAATAQRAIETAGRISSALWREFEHDYHALRSYAALPEPQTFAEARAQVLMLDNAVAMIGLYGASVYDEDLTSLSRDLASAGRGAVHRFWARLTNRPYREARKRLLGLRTTRASDAVLLAEVSRIRADAAAWRNVKTKPTAIPESTRLKDALTRLEEAMRELAEILGDSAEDLYQLPLDDMGAWLRTLGADTITPRQLPRVYEITNTLTAAGAGNLAAEIRTARLPSTLWTDALTWTWLSSALEQVWAEDSSLASFVGEAHNTHVEGFRRRDRERVQIAAARVRRAHAEHVVAVMNQFPDETAIVRGEARKKRNHRTLRDLLEKAPNVLTALFPCWMASPLSVSQLLGAKERYFDLTLFDEASQVPPEDAIPSMLRAGRIVVAGDRHQLPPTVFFADGGPPVTDEDETPLNPTEGFESLLDAMDTFLPPWMLEWHYRSRDESLIAFSNRHIYHDRLVTFPGPAVTSAVEYINVACVPGVDGQEESAAKEVRTVVDMILRHAETKADLTLGVITMGIRHMNRIQMALDAALRGRRDDRILAFFSPEKPERFFVKNLERVQGDERDEIILSVGYGKDRGGKLHYRFGPILMQGGERRLNVAVTRARSRMTVVSSFTHEDMDAGRSSAKGAEFLRLYLQYAKSGARILGDETRDPVPLNGFEADIMDTLTARGIPLLPQFGASRYRLDLAAKHPEKPGRLVLAIECDGATYHSSPTARDRDRLRQEVLERLGWRFHRIWSTDWFNRREQEIERAVAAYHHAVAHADRVDLGGSQTSVPVPVPVTPMMTQPRERAPKPFIPSRPSIDDYSLSELRKIVDWVNSDDALRTDAEIRNEVFVALPFTRRGPRIMAAIDRAIAHAKRTKTKVN